MAPDPEQPDRLHVPAAGTPRDGDHHVLPARVPGLDVVHRLRPHEPAGQRPAPNYVGLQNYGRILDNNIVIPNFDFLRILVFNLFWAFSNVVIHVVLGVMIALILNVKGLRFKRFYRAIYILPVVIPPIIVATVWRNLFDPHYGAINQLINGTIGGSCSSSRR